MDQSETQADSPVVVAMGDQGEVAAGAADPSNPFAEVISSY